MNTHIQSTKSRFLANKKEYIIGLIVVLGGIIVIGIIALSIYNSTPKIVYQPAKACDLLTTDEAKNLLGGKALRSSESDPVITRDTATSKCGYADGSTDKNDMVVAAIMVRSGVNDNGVEQNKNEFTKGKPSVGVEDIKGLGENAYFNEKLGQLNVLSERDWIVLSYGVGSAPEANTLEDAVELARVVVQTKKL